MRIRLGLGVCAVSLALSIHFAGADTYSVINTTDSGPGSLRQAILDANAHANINASTPDVISFAIPGPGLQTITPLSVLPTITDPVVIDGYTQPGSNANTAVVGNNSVHLIELNGNSAVCGALVITAGNSTVRGLVINRFNGNCGNTAILLQTGGGNRVEGCFLGLDATGTAASTNRDFGVRIENSPNNTIGGTTPAARNVISGNNTQIQINGNVSSGTTIQGNYIGTNAAGTAALSNGGVSQSVVGININTNIATSGPSNTIVGGTTAAARNVISGNAAGNINFFGSSGSGNVIQGNYIGINAAGTAAVDLNGPGIILTYSSNFTIGGTVAGAGNVISGNSSGITISGDANNMAANNLIQGNLIGTNAAGAAAVPNGNGISISEGQNNTIGGTTASARNIISGNAARGVVITTGYNFPVVTANVVQGNFIGTDITGTAKLGNSGAGVVVAGIFGATLTGVNTIGGATAGAGNIISSNASDGISIGTANNTLVQGNFIGTDVNGTGNLGNAGIGISLSGASTNTIGGVTPGAGNVIAFNGSASVTFSGVVVYSGAGNSILGNSIFSNNRLGIDLAGDGAVAANDACDADTGANNLQNYPVIKSVTNTPGSVNITGTLNSAASTTFRLEFFRNVAIDPSGYGEGQVFLGFANVTTDASCNATFNLNFPSTSTALRVAATATDPLGNTSEFSAAIGQLLNISTRLKVETGDNVLIGGFIVTGSDQKKVIIRGTGPSLANVGIQGFLENPTLQLFQGNTLVRSNDDWKIREDGSSQQAEIEATTIAPTNELESAIVATLSPNVNYTAVVRGKDNKIGIGVVEAFDLDQAANSRLANISTRGFVDTGNDILIGGFITGNGLTKVIVRAIGPSLPSFITNPLQDPTLELKDVNGTTIRSNDNWKIREDGMSQQAEIEATTIPPTNELESALVQTLQPGNYTAVVRGKNNSVGTAVVEVYNIQ